MIIAAATILIALFIVAFVGVGEWLITKVDVSAENEHGWEASKNASE